MGNVYKHLAGAKNHSIVMPDADLDTSVTEIIGAAYGSAGERCMACAVVVAVGDVAEQLIDKLMEAADDIKIGNGMDDGVFLGPVIRPEHKEQTANYIEIGQEEGAKLLRDGREDACMTEEGYFIGPTIFDNVTTEMRIWKEEIFAPVLSIVRVDNIRRSN